MTTITGMTAAKMLEIQNASVVSGEIDGSDHLILTTYGGTDIDAGLISTGDMNLANNQTVTGVKTFNAGTFLDKGSMVYNVKAYGAVGDGTTDDTAALQAAVDAAQAAGGGSVWIPRATYKLATNPLKLYSGSGASLVSYNNIRIFSDGATLAQSTTGVDVIKALVDTTYGMKSTNIKIENLTLNFSGTATNSGNGLNLAQQAASGPVYTQWNVQNVLVNNCQGSGKYGFLICGVSTSTFQRCRTLDCANGFWINGGANGNFTSGSNSSSFINCYADMGTNGVNAFRLTESTFLTFSGCGVLYRATSTGSAYQLECCNSIKFDACGFELDGTNTLDVGYKITVNSLSYGSGQIVIDAGYCFQSKSTKEVWVTGGCNATVKAFQSNSSVSGSTGLTVDGTVYETLSQWATATPRAFSATGKWVITGSPRVQGQSATTTPTPAAGITDLLFVSNAAAGMTVGAPTGPVDDGQILEIQYRDNGGAARSIAHNAIFMNGAATMVTTTVLGKTVREVFQYSTGATKWACMSSSAAGW